MSGRLTDEELRAIRERAEKATPGKWYYEVDGDLYSEETRKRVLHPYMTAESIPYMEVSEDDATFIAHARQDIPKLLAEIERVNEDNEYLKRENERYRDFLGDLIGEVYSHVPDIFEPYITAERIDKALRRR